MTGTTVVTFKAEHAEDRIARFLDWAEGKVEVQDLGTLGSIRRYKVPSAAWKSYTQSVSRP